MSYNSRIHRSANTYLCLTKINLECMNAVNLRDIKKLRLARHWSQEQLSEMSGLSIRTIQRIEKGENAGVLELLLKSIPCKAAYCKLFKVPSI